MRNDIHRAAEIVMSSSHAVAFTGAGISTPSGIPDFRTPGSGLWSQVDPMEVASIWSFLRRPEAFYEWVRPMIQMFREAQPNPAHLALAQLESMGLLHAVITQNIDELHQRAGSTRVLELHGHMREATCLSCYKIVSSSQGLMQIIEEGQVPHCECGGVLKPNVVLFGEMLPVDVLTEAEREARACDVMLVAGSSLEVVPAAELPAMALRSGARLIIVNRQPTPMDRRADVVIHGDVAEVLPRIAELCERGKS
jgi:NAD-dependent deacetylase